MDTRFLIGLAGALGAVVVWELIPGHEQFALQQGSRIPATAEPEKSPLAFLEHYHLGMASLIAGKAVPKYSPYMYGFGAGMISSEFFQDHPFGIGKTSQEMKGNLATAIVLWSILAILL